ncbi:MAG: multidrug transporter [Deltaproteobacteria bacterium CG2_30_66_27]|nr:MAG: multidrug transporter [Deltaproteobacteria bacterium CG2_30_66_27]
MKRMKTVLRLSLGVFLFLCGCSMAPKYTRPEAPVPAAWPSGPAYDNARFPSGAPAAAGLDWREFFTDERLRKVIEAALRNNRDLRVAALNVEKARAYYGIQRAGLLPTVDATGRGRKERVPSSTFGGARGSLLIERYDVNLGVSSWEIDFFGRIRSLKDAALQEYLATGQARRGAQILLVSGVADAYLTLAADRENLRLAQSTMDTRQAAYNLIRRRFDAGLSTGLDLRQAQTRVDAARVDTALYSRLAAQDENALTLLVGSKVPAGLLPDNLTLVSPAREISPGLSSEVLLLRPDILQAENLLKAANADIGAARAALFPRISLTTAFGTASGELSGLFQSGSEAWNFTPQIIVPIFDARAWSALEAIKVERKIAVARYEKVLQTAFREVADALAVRGTVEDQMSAQESLVEAASETYRLSNARYTKGIDSFLGVLDAQRSLYAAQQGLVSLRLAKFANQVTLYAVLGGGGDQAVPR